MNTVLPLWLACGLYLWQAWNYYRIGDIGMAGAFVGYTVANIGFIYATVTRGAS